MVYLDTTRDILPTDGLSVPELSRMGLTSDDGPPAYQPHTHAPKGFQETLTYGFQTALGVRAACPDRAVIFVTRDDGLIHYDESDSVLACLHRRKKGTKLGAFYLVGIAPRERSGSTF